MAIQDIDTKCYILALFIRDDGERFLLGSGRYEFKDKQRHFAANTMQNDVVEVQGNDGFLLAGQVKRPGSQSFDGYVGDGTTSKQEVEEYRRDFFSFFRKNFFYQVIYIFPDGTAIQRKRGFLVDAPVVQELYQVYPEYHVALNFEDVNYYSYSENASGEEEFAKSATISLSSGGSTGGLVWDELGAVAEGFQWGEVVTATGTEITVQNDSEGALPITDVKMYGNTVQSGTPTPDSPQAIQTVTGRQLVTVSNGSTSEDYEINLGDIELCKIGDYQDYIYRSGTEWYLHKEVSKVVLDQSGTYTLGSTSTAGVSRIRTNAIANLIKYPASGADKGSALSSHFVLTTAGQNYDLVEGFAVETNGNLVFYKGGGLTQTVSNFTTWLASNPVTIYYVLATPTDTRITNQALIEDLNGLVGAAFQKGENQLTVSSSAGIACGLEISYYGSVDFEGGGFVWEEGGPSGPTTVEVDSIENVYPIWEVKGPATNPQLSVLTTNTTLRYNGTVAAGQTLTIDMMSKTATLNGTSVIGNVSGEWVNFVPGNNRVVYTTNNANAESSTIYWQEVVG